MRRVYCGIGLLGLLSGPVGCQNDAILRPPKHPEEFRVPPADARYTNPPEPPKEYLNEDILKNRTGPDLGGPGGSGGPGRPGGLRAGGP